MRDPWVPFTADQAAGLMGKTPAEQQARRDAYCAEMDRQTPPKRQPRARSPPKPDPQPEPQSLF